MSLTLVAELSSRTLLLVACDNVSILPTGMSTGQMSERNFSHMRSLQAQP